MNWKDIFVKDWHLKLISLSFSILLWSFVVGQEKAEIGLSIPIEIVNLPSNMVIANDIPSNIEIRVFGPRSIIKNIASRNLTKVINLKDATVGKVVIHLAADDFSLPGGVKVLRIKPSIITFEIQPLLRKTVFVKAIIQNKPAPGYEVKKVVVKPSTTQISGPAKLINSIKELKLSPIDVKGATKSFNVVTTPDLQKYRISVEGPSKFEVTVYIKPARGERKIRHVPVRLILGEYQASIWPTEITVKLCGEVPSLQKLKVEDIKASIDITQFKPGTYKLEPKVEVPPGFECLKITPKKIRVWIKRSKRK